MSHRALVIIASSLGVILVAVLVVLSLALIRGVPTASETPTPAVSLSADPQQQEAQTTPDTSVDFGACTTLEGSALSRAFQSVNITPRPAENRGVGYDGEGWQSQNCLYRFNEGPALNDRLTVTVTPYPSIATRDAYISGLETATEIGDIGQAAYFTAFGDDEENRYLLVVVNELRVHTFMIQQPAELDKFDRDSARATLVTLAQQSAYSR